MSSLTATFVASSIERRVPLSVQIDLTMRCNEVCVHCYRVVEDREELTGDEIKSLLDDLASLGTLYLTFSGGEVFLRRDLFEIIEYAKRGRFDVRLKSNALLVTEARARRLRALGVRQVDVSIYAADPTVHDAVTKVPGSLQRTIAGITHLAATGLRVKINCPIMRANVAVYGDIKRLADRLGVACGFDPMITAKNDGDTAPLALRIKPLDYQRVARDPLVNGAAALPPSPPGVRADLDEAPCGASHSACYVSSYGDVMPCVAMPIACGNLREQRFRDIWYASPQMMRVRAVRVRDLTTCHACTASAFCTRCPGQAMVEDGDLLAPSTAACEQALAGAQAVGSPEIPASMLRPAIFSH